MNQEKLLVGRPSRLNKILAISAATISLCTFSLKEAGAEIKINTSETTIKNNKPESNKCSSAILVKPGDTVYGLSKKIGQTLGFPISVEEFRRVYGISENNLIKANSCLTPVTEIKIIVKKGDTLYGIAQENSMTVTELMLMNNLSSNLIFPGQALNILGKTEASQQITTSTTQPIQTEKVNNLEKVSIEKQIEREAQQINEETKINGVKVEIAQKAYIHWRKLAITPMGSALLVAYASAESAFDVSIPGDEGKALGLFQWQGERQEGMPGINEPLEKFLDFTLLEMKRETPELYEAITNSNSTKDELKDLAQQWLRPGIKGRREEFFDSVYDDVKKALPSETQQTNTAPATPTPTPTSPTPTPANDNSSQATFSKNKKLDEEQSKDKTDGGNDEPPKLDLNHRYIQLDTLKYHETEDVSTVEIQGIPVNIEIAKNLAQMIEDAEKEGVTLKLLSGYRSSEKQYQIGIENGCGVDTSQWPDSCEIPTAQPGKSNHQKGLAVDFAVYDYNWLAKNAEKYGLYNKIFQRELWHWSVTGY